MEEREEGRVARHGELIEKNEHTLNPTTPCQISNTYLYLIPYLRKKVLHFWVVRVDSLNFFFQIKAVKCQFNYIWNLGW